MFRKNILHLTNLAQKSRASSSNVRESVIREIVKYRELATQIKKHPQLLEFFRKPNEYNIIIHKDKRKYF